MNGTSNNKVNGVFYSWWMKLLVILLSLIMVAMASTGVWMIASNLEQLTMKEAISGTEYAYSENAYSYLMDHMQTVVETRVNQRSFLGKNGVFDGAKTVDIMNPFPAKGDEKNKNTTYKLSDLLSLYQTGNLMEISDCLDNSNDEDVGYYADGNLLVNLEERYDLHSFFRDHNGQLYGVNGGEVRGLSNTRDVLDYEYSSDDLRDMGGKDKFQGISEYLFVINKDGSARQYVFGSDKDVDLIYTSRADAMARLLDTSELKKNEDISKYYGVYGERFCYLYSNCRPLEKVMPVSGRTLACYALLHPYDFSIADAYTALLGVSEQILNAYESADQVVNCGSTFDRGTSASEEAVSDPEEANSERLFYFYDFDKKEVITNMEAWKQKTAEEVYGEVCQYEEAYEHFPYVYVSYDGNTQKRITNIPEGISADAANLVYEYLEGYITLDAESYDLIMLQNPKYPLKPANTIFNREEGTIFGSAKVDFRNGQIFAVVGGFLFLVLMILSMIQVANPAGVARYHENGKRIYRTFTWICKIPICVLLLIFILIWTIWGCGLAYGVEFYDLNLISKNLILLWVAAWVSGAGIAMWNILTLLAKIKTRSFWTNSILGWFCKSVIRMCRTIYMHRKATGRVLLIYGLVTMAAILGLLMLTDNDFAGFGVLLLLIDWAALGYYLLKKSIHRQTLKESIAEIADGNLEYQIKLSKLSGDELEMAKNLNNLKGGMQNAINEQMKSERMKTDLITNVSHDIKTPLTSIINYVDLLKREDIQDEKIAGYIDILDSKSARLKQLTEDLVEASKISSGNIVLDCVNLDLGQLIQQVNGEFSEKFENRNLELLCNLPDEPLIIYADGRRVSRVFENLYNNAAKYAMPGTRIYVTGEVERNEVILSIKNISEQPLNVSADELMERFVRGDVSRSTEGSGLGLEIARNLTLIQNGQFELYVDGDLFRATTRWKKAD